MYDYPTQKPVALLERIIQASSNKGDVVLDPFCGCGTTIAAAQKLNREWIGIDVTHLAVGLMKLRLKDSFGMLPQGTKAPKGSPPGQEGWQPSSADGVVDLKNLNSGETKDAGALTEQTTPSGKPGHPSLTKEGNLGTYRVIGQPEDLDGAKELALNDRYGGRPS